jgi:hypothetical protein
MGYGSARNHLLPCSFCGGLKESLRQGSLRLDPHPGPGPYMTVNLDTACRPTDKRRRLIELKGDYMGGLPQVVPGGVPESLY